MVIITFIICILASAHADLPDIDVGRPQIIRPDSFSVLDRDSLANSALPSGDDVLRSVPGLTVSRSGGSGQSSSVFIRGADSAGTLVLIDGFPVNDPSLSNGSFDFSNLNLDGLERIEVWKGPQSVMFGSGATGGVINIITKKGQGPLTTGAALLAGTQDTTGESAFLRGSKGPWSYALSVAHNQTQGISAADAVHGGQEADGSSANNFSWRGGWSPRASTEIETVWRISERKSDLDYAPSTNSPFFIQADAPNYRSQQRTETLGIKVRQDWGSELSSELGISRVSQSHSYRNDPSLDNPDRVNGSYSGSVYHLENRNHWKFAPGAELLIGPTADFEQADSVFTTSGFQTSFPQKSNSLVGLMARLQWDKRFYFLTAGARVDRHNLFGNQTSLELTPGLHLLPDLDFFVRGSTAYKAPTLFELYDPMSGNPSLAPENEQSLEVGLAKYFAERRMKVQVSAFSSKFRNIIQWQTHFTNVGSADVRGAELEGSAYWGWLTLNGGYTYLETRDDATGSELLRRPRNAITARVELANPQTPSLRGSVEFVSADHRADIDPLSNQILIDASYQVVNASLSWQAIRDLKFTLNALNVLDLKYNEVAGYNAQPFSVYLGAVYAWTAHE